MADSSKITFLPGTTGSCWQPVGTLVAATTQRRDSNTIFRSRVRPERTRLEQVTAEAPMTLQDAAVAATLAAERAFSYVEDLEEALAILEQAVGTPAAGTPTDPLPSATAPLSPREREVLALVTAGQTNRAIAEMLCVSTNTVKTHVTSLLRKLQVNSRVQLAALATRHGLD
jgi:DNA-binding NarL/FixJ family response regulator